MLSVQKHGRCAFTLTEMLVVMAITLLLVAILFPAIVTVRQHANMSKCAANLRHWGSAAHLYAGEHNGRLPWPQNTRATPRPTNNWAGTMYPYVSGGGIADQWYLVQRILSPEELGCPSNDPAETGVGQPFFCYKMNGFLMENVAGGGQVGVYVSSVREPSKTLMMADGRSPGQSADCKFYYASMDSASSGSNGSQAIAYPHGGRSNFLFVDGHVESKSYNEVEDDWSRIVQP